MKLLNALIMFLTIVTFQIFCKSEVNSKEMYTHSSKFNIVAFRLKPNQDLKKEIDKFAKENKIKAGYILTTVGSLKKLSLRLANEKEATTIEDKFEIVSLVGTFSQEGIHLHIAVSDKTGKTIGGHLLEGNLIYTTAEIVVGISEDMLFKREEDIESGFKELNIYEGN